ncbi:MAG: WG repeat-containing protein [Bacteroidetes bacterium]|nr:WG repeat-containing protein [Bacteroidota bacterium]
MSVIIYLLLFLQFLLTIFTLINVAKNKNRNLAILCSFCFLFPAFAFVVAFLLHIELLHQNHYLSISLLGCLLLLISSILLSFSKKIKPTIKILSTITGLGALALGFILVMINREFRSEILFKERIYENFYLTFFIHNDGQLCSTKITIENATYIKRNINQGGIYGWEIPDKIKFISFKDSILKFSIAINNEENIAIVDTRFDYISNQFNGVRVVRRDRAHGVIDSTGKILIPFGRYDYLGHNYNGLLYAQKNNKVGYVDRNGNILIPFKFDGGGNFLSDSATVRLNDKSYWINKKGEILSLHK